MSRPSTTVSRSVVLMQDADMRAEIVAMLAATLNYEGTVYSTNEELNGLVPSLVPDVAVVVADFVEAAQLAELFTIMTKKNLSVPVIVIAKDIAPLAKIKEFGLVYACARYPLVASELESIVRLARDRFKAVQDKIEEITGLKLIGHAVAILLARHSSDIQTFEQGYARLRNNASSWGLSPDAYAKRIVNNDKVNHPRVSERSRDQGSKDQP